jgi:hypothetical protein
VKSPPDFRATTRSSARKTAPIGEILKGNGYATSWFGKNHNTPSYQATQAGPFDQWPNGMGFEYFYGFMGGDASQWQPNLYRNTTAIYPFEGKPGWNLTTAMADEAIQYMKELKAVAPDKPFLVYYVPGGTHSPHHPTPEWIKKISDMKLFDQGWNKVRETIFANQKRLGIMPPEAQLTPWPKELPQWDSLGVCREEAVHQAGRRLRRLPGLYRQRDRPRHPGGRGHGSAGQHPDHLHRRRQRREPRGHAQRHAERVHHLQRRRRCRSMPSCSGIRSGGPTRPSRTSRHPGPGPWTRRSSGPSRWRRTTVARPRAWRCPGPATSPTRAASAASSTM